MRPIQPPPPPPQQQQRTPRRRGKAEAAAAATKPPAKETKAQQPSQTSPAPQQPGTSQQEEMETIQSRDSFSPLSFHEEDSQDTNENEWKTVKGKHTKKEDNNSLAQIFQKTPALVQEKVKNLRKSFETVPPHAKKLKLKH